MHELARELNPIADVILDLVVITAAVVALAYGLVMAFKFLLERRRAKSERRRAEAESRLANQGRSPETAKKQVPILVGMLIVFVSVLIVGVLIIESAELELAPLLLLLGAVVLTIVVWDNGRNGETSVAGGKHILKVAQKRA